MPFNRFADLPVNDLLRLARSQAAIFESGNRSFLGELIEELSNRISLYEEALIEKQEC